MKNFLIITLFLCANLIQAQLIPENIELEVENSNLIIEGEVISQTYFKSLDGYISTKSLIRPSKIFKGNIRSNKLIEVVTKGGQLDGITESWTHILHLKKGDYGIFFLEESQDSENSFDFWDPIKGFLKLKNTNLEWNRLTPRSYNLQTVYQEIQKNTNTELKILDNSERHNSDNCLKLIISQRTIDNSIGQNIYFSVFAKMNEHPRILNEIVLEMSYDTNILGENIIQSGLLSVNEGGQFIENDYTLEAFDAEINKIRVRISKNNGQNLIIDLFEKELLQFTLNLPIELNYNELLFAVSYYNLTSSLIDPIDGTINDDNCKEIEFPSRACDFTIDDFNPKIVAAGVKDESLSNVPGYITITGKGFGNPSTGLRKPYFSDVLFWDVDANDYFKPAILEYKSWKDGKIVVRVPTQQIGGDPARMSPGASTGIIKLSIYDCDTETYCEKIVGKLKVRFGMFNDPWSRIAEGVKRCLNYNPQDIEIFGGSRRNLVSIDNQGGYKLFIDDLFSDPVKNAEAKDQIIKALDVWRCDYRINVETVDDVSNANCRVMKTNILPCKLKNGSAEVTIIRTVSESDNCSPNNRDDSAIIGFDFLVNDNIINECTLTSLGLLKFNTSDYEPVDAAPPVYYFDMQRVMLHEFGHAFQLRHTNNPEDIMFAGGMANNFERNLSANDDKGGLHLMYLSKLGACNFPAMTEYDCTTSTKEELKLNKYNVIPNPTSSNVQISSKIAFNKCDVFSIQGTLLTTFHFQLSEKTKIKMPRNLQNGLYMLKITNTNNGKFGFTKIILQK